MFVLTYASGANLKILLDCVLSGPGLVSGQVEMARRRLEKLQLLAIVDPPAAGSSPVSCPADLELRLSAFTGHCFTPLFFSCTAPLDDPTIKTTFSA